MLTVDVGALLNDHDALAPQSGVVVVSAASLSITGSGSSGSEEKALRHAMRFQPKHPAPSPASVNYLREWRAFRICGKREADQTQRRYMEMKWCIE